MRQLRFAPSLVPQLVVSLVALVGVVACAQDIGDIDRTQPGKLKKSALAGEWHFRQTVVDVPYTTGVTFIGEQSLLDRVRFEISEDFLTAYRTYERVTGSEAPSQLDGEPYQGAPVAAFRILKHFDVDREYNPATGEQTNVLYENDVDRPWYEREHLRVDWSQNLLANFDFLAAGQAGLGVVTQSASYAVTDPNSVDAPVFAQKSAGSWSDVRDPMVWGELDSVDYFDVTLKLQVTPDSFLVEYDDGTSEEWPACWFYDIGPWDCTSQTVKVRASFLKVVPTDYVALPYPDNAIARDADGEAIRVGYDDGADDTYGRCSTPSPDCTPARIPMFDRFGYFRIERESYDRDYELTEEGRTYLINRFNIWEKSRDDAGNVIPMAARRVKPIVYHLSPEFPEALVPTAEEVAGWWNDAFTATVQGLGATVSGPVFSVTRNTYRAEGGQIVEHGQRNGDLRYNHLYWVDDPQFESLLGYGPSGADPLTGEIIAADAYVYGGAIDTYAAYGADVVDLMRGELDPNTFLEGENIGAAVARIRDGRNPSGAEMRQRSERLYDRGLGERLQQIRQRRPEDFRADFDAVHSRLRLGDDSPVLDGLWNHEVSRAYEARFGRRMKPSELSGRRLQSALRKQRQALGKRAVDVRPFEDAAVLGLVGRMAGLSHDEVKAYVRAAVFASTAAHEIGHTLGLRHNFAGSTDALNYFDAYWDIRDPSATTLDLPSHDEMAAGLREYTYSSIMDYGAKFVSDIQGVGRYDAAAVAFGYGELVEVFANAPNFDGNILAYTSLDDAVGNWLHYSQLPSIFESAPGAGDGPANMRARTFAPLSEVVDFYTAGAGGDDFVDRIVPYKFCSDEYDGAEWDCATWDEGADPYEITSYAIQTYRDYYIFDAFKRNRRYLDPIDYYSSVYGRSMLPLATQYHMWIFDQWDKAGTWDYFNDLDQSEGSSVTTSAEWALDPNGGLSGTTAAMISVNFLTEVLATPEPGSYYTDPANPNVRVWYGNWQDPPCGPGENSYDDLCSDVYIPVGTGRYAYSEFDEDSGYYWYEKVRVVGSFWDKLAAIETLADPSAYFLGVDDVANFSQFILGFNVAFPHVVETVFGAAINDDYKKFAFEQATDGSLSLRPPLEDALMTYGDTPGPDRIGPFIDPATNFTVAIYALFYGMALLPLNFDQGFNDHAKVWLEGSGEAFVPDPSRPPQDIATFTNPFNGRVYHALKSPDPVDYSLGFEMLNRAETLANAVEADNCVFGNSADCVNKRWELENLISNVELVRGYYDIFGYSYW